MKYYYYYYYCYLLLFHYLSFSQSVKGMWDPPTILSKHNTVGVCICHWPTMSAASHSDLSPRCPDRKRIRVLANRKSNMFENCGTASGTAQDEVRTHL